MALFNRPQSFLVAQANETARGADVDIEIKQGEVAYRVASLFLDAEQAARSVAAVEREGANLARVKELMDVRVEEGRELPIESKKANLGVLRTRLRAEGLSSDLLTTETSLALALGYGPDDRVHPAAEERAMLEAPVSEEGSIEKALEESHELRKLESSLQAKMLEIKSYHAERLPKVNLVAQYALLGRYNNFQQYFSKFSR